MIAIGIRVRVLLLHALLWSGSANILPDIVVVISVIPATIAVIATAAITKYIEFFTVIVSLV